MSTNSISRRSAMFCLAAIAALSPLTVSADDSHHKDSVFPLEVTETMDINGGGFGGMRYRIQRDGTWTLDTVENFQGETIKKGRLTKHEMAALTIILRKYKLRSLEVSGEGSNNPHRVNIKVSGRLISYRGPAAIPMEVTVQGRVSAVLNAVKLFVQ